MGTVEIRGQMAGVASPLPPRGFPEIEFMFPGLVASSFINQTILPALHLAFLGAIKPFSKVAHILHSLFFKTMM